MRLGWLWVNVHLVQTRPFVSLHPPVPNWLAKLLAIDARTAAEGGDITRTHVEIRGRNLEILVFGNSVFIISSMNQKPLKARPS